MIQIRLFLGCCIVDVWGGLNNSTSHAAWFGFEWHSVCKLYLSFLWQLFDVADKVPSLRVWLFLRDNLFLRILRAQRRCVRISLVHKCLSIKDQGSLALLDGFLRLRFDSTAYLLLFLTIYSFYYWHVVMIRILVIYDWCLSQVFEPYTRPSCPLRANQFLVKRFLFLISKGTMIIDYSLILNIASRIRHIDCPFLALMKHFQVLFLRTHSLWRHERVTLGCPLSAKELSGGRVWLAWFLFFDWQIVFEDYHRLRHSRLLIYSNWFSFREHIVHCDWLPCGTSILWLHGLMQDLSFFLMLVESSEIKFSPDLLDMRQHANDLAMLKMWSCLRAGVLLPLRWCYLLWHSIFQPPMLALLRLQALPRVVALI